MIEPLETRLLLTVYKPADFAQLVTMLGQAQLGDTIELTAGATYSGSLTLPNKTTGSGWITIQSSAMDKLPAAGVRVTPADAVNMPKLIAPAGSATMVNTAVSAHHYQFIGIEFVAPLNNADLVTGIQFGDYSAAQDTVAEVPHHLNIDRSYIHGFSNSQKFRRAIALHSDYSDITNSWVSQVQDQGGSDSQAIAGWNGVGHYNILNNHLEGTAENIMFGGVTMNIPNVVPSDILIRGNHLIKPLDIKGVWPVKNLFEIKTARRVTLDGNILENCWVSGQTGPAIVLKTNKDATWATTDDITITNNVIRNAAGGFQLQGLDYINNHGHLWNVTIRNNLFTGIGDSFWGSNGRLFQITDGPKNITVDHNTAFHTGNVIATDQKGSTGLVFTNNVMPHNSFGIIGDSMGIGNDTITKAFADSIITKNILMGGNANSYSSRPGNYFPANWGLVGFVDQANANYRLLASSTYHNAGTDSQDLGCDFNALELKVAGVANGWFYGTVGVDTFTVKRTVNGTRFEVSNPAWVAGSLPAIPFVDNWIYYQGLTFNGGDGNDVLNVDYSGGSPVPAVRGIYLDGGNATDTLNVIGNNVAATYSPNATTNGRGKVSAGGDINFTNSESITASGLTGFTLVTPNPQDSITIDSQLVNTFRVSGTSAGVGMTAATLPAGTPLTLQLALNDTSSWGADGVTVSSNTPGLTSLALDAGWADDAVTHLSRNGVGVGNGNNFTLNTNLGIGGQLVVLNMLGSSQVTLPGNQTLDEVVISNGGKVKLPAGGGGTLRLRTLTQITGAGSQLDLADNDLIVDYSGFTPLGNSATFTGISKLLRDGRNGGAWNGIGIVTSMTAAKSPSMLTTLGVAEAKDVLSPIGGTWNEQSVDGTALLVKYSYAGDGDLSGTIDGDDFFLIDAGISGGARGYYAGDFDYSQGVDADDYFAIDANYPKGQVAMSLPVAGAEIPHAMAFGATDERTLIDELI